MIKASKIIKNSKGHHEKLLGLPTVAIQLSFGGDQDNLHLKNHHYLFLAKNPVRESVSKGGGRKKHSSQHFVVCFFSAGP